MSDSIHQELTLKATPQRVYEVLTDARQFSDMTGGAPAAIDGKAGGAFSCFGGAIEGRQVELVPGQRIVQAWRAKTWESGVYSIVRFELKPQGGATQLVFEHAGFPPDQREHLTAGWKSNYWAPLEKYLA